MYIVSQPKPLFDDLNRVIAGEDSAFFPQGYLRFLQQFGEGNYRGWMNVQLPDDEVLKAFAEYGFWEHDADSPITQQQIGECISIGTTVDGDFLAVHPPTDQLLWLPRHAEHLKAFSLQVQEQADARTYALVLDEIYRQVYGSDQEGAVYYETWSGSQSHLFLRLPPGKDQLSLPELSGMCREAFLPDLVVETQYTCRLFYRQLGGYIRFNYATGSEVFIMYEQDKQQTFAIMEQWLLSKGCETYFNQ